MTIAQEIPVPIHAGRGIAFALTAFAGFATADAVIKTLGGQFSVFQIAFTMAFFAFIPALGLTIGRGGLSALIPRKRRWVLVRAGLTACCCFLAWEAFARLPLAEAYALIFMAPVFVTILSVLVLGEVVGWRRRLSVAAGFIGVLVILDPDFASLQLGHLFALIASMFGALSFLVLRKIGKEEPSAAILAALFAALALTSAGPAFAHWVTPTWQQFGFLALAGLLFGSAQAGLVMATREVPAALIAPFQYTQMLWAVAYGVLLFGDPPTVNLLIGSAIVVGSGLFIAWRESVLARPVSLTTGRGEVVARASRNV